MEDIIPVDIPTTLLQKAKTLNKDTIGRKYDFLTTKGNEFIQVDPPSAKFAGYEINKLNTIKIKVLNKATIPQRIHVLPLESNTFTVKMNKKGLLPTGMAEELLISFKPTEYKYFFDTLRINTETENILVPIHAYPVLDRDNLRNIFPRLIDFGTIIIGETSTITSFLTCKIPINFEFEFVFTNHHSDMVISPIKGIIPGNGNVEISIQYTASTNTTIVCEAELRISQFDFEPLKIRLMGSGRYEDPAQNKKKLALTSTQGGIFQRPHSNPRLQRLDRSGLQGSIVNNDQEKASQLVNSQNIIKEEDNKKNEEISSKTQQQLKGTSTVEDEKLSLSMRASKDKNFKVRSLAQPGSSASALMKNSSKVTYKLTKEDIEEQQDNEEEDNSRQRNSEEREFIEKCNAVQLMDKNKDVKFFQCVGDEELTEQEINSINQERTDFNQGVLDGIHEEGIHRYTKKVNADHVLLGQRNLELSTECTWDEDKNDSLKLRKHILSKFMNAGTRIILKMRMENRLMKLKNLLCDCKTKADVKQLVINDWLKAEYAGVGQKEFIAFEFDYSENDVEENLLPVQYEASNTINEFKFEVTPRKDFIDLDLNDYTLFGRNEVEIMKYSNYDRPLCPNYAPIEENRQNRTGAEWEYSSNDRIGQTKQFSESEGLLDPMAKTYLKPIEMPSHHFITQHNTLRPYIPSQLFTEVDVEYYLQPEAMQIQDSLDPNISGEFFSLKNEFLGKTPGLSSRFALYSVYSEPLRYLPSLLKLPRDCGYIDKSEMHCPHALKECDYDDHLTDDDSDGEEPPVVEVLNADDLLKQIEDKDEIIKKLREINSERLPFDELENTVNIINSNFHCVKQQQISTLPSLSDNYNKTIEQRQNKLIIL